MHVGIANPLWREKRSQHSQRMCIPQIYVSGMSHAIAPAPVKESWRVWIRLTHISLQWLHNGRYCVSNHQPHDCLLRRRSKKTPKLGVTGLCEGNSPVTGEFPAQRASNVENVSIWWRYHVTGTKHNKARIMSMHLVLYCICHATMSYLILSTNPSYYCISFCLLSQWDSPRDLRSLAICQCQTRQRLVTGIKDYIVFPLARQITVGAIGRSLTPLLLKTECSGPKKSMTWLIMPWLLVLPYHQQPWYWFREIHTTPLLSMGNDFIYLHHQHVQTL